MVSLAVVRDQYKLNAFNGGRPNESASAHFRWQLLEQRTCHRTGEQREPHVLALRDVCVVVLPEESPCSCDQKWPHHAPSVALGDLPVRMGQVRLDARAVEMLHHLSERLFSKK